MKYRNMKKVTVHKNEQSITENNSLGKSDRCKINFMHLDHQDKNFQEFPTNYCISLRNTGIYKQTDKHTISLIYLKLSLSLSQGRGWDLGDITQDNCPCQKSNVKSHSPSKSQKENISSLLYFIWRYLQLVLNSLMYFIQAEAAEVVTTVVISVISQNSVNTPWAYIRTKDKFNGSIFEGWRGHFEFQSFKLFTFFTIGKNNIYLKKRQQI